MHIDRFTKKKILLKTKPKPVTEEEYIKMLLKGSDKE